MAPLEIMGNKIPAPLVIGGVAVAGLVAYTLAKKAGQAVVDVVDTGKGILTGDNALTHNATDADGKPVTAYEGAGVVGTAGAAANAVSGGTLASVGNWIGDRLFDVFGTKADTAPATTARPATSTSSAPSPLPAGTSFQDASSTSWNWTGFGAWGPAP